MSSQPLILIVEDEPPILDNIAEILEIHDYEVHTAMNGVEGVEAARRVRPDLILCDINMPEMDGYSALVHLRNDPLTSEIPFVFLTAFVDREFQRRGMTLGAEDYLTKPFTPHELLETVKTQLEKSEERKSVVEGLRNNLISSLPHELRTPLTGIVTCADLLLMDIEEDTFDPRRAEQTIRIIHNSGQRLQRLIENHLIYSQLALHERNEKQQSAMVYGEGLETPMGVITVAAHQVGDQVERTQDIRMSETTNHYVRVTDSNLHKIIYELVDNALKFSQPGDPVTIQTGAEGEMYNIVVEDQGRGFQPEHIQQIGAYRQFEREHYEQQGMGLGLAIAMRLAQLHEGTVTVESQAGTGTRVTVALPNTPRN